MSFIGGERERERERAREREEKVGMVVRDTTLGDESRESNVFGLGFQAVLASPSARGKAYDQNVFKIYFLWR
jgi:hypothetical protein